VLFALLSLSHFIARLYLSICHSTYPSLVIPDRGKRVQQTLAESSIPMLMSLRRMPNFGAGTSAILKTAEEVCQATSVSNRLTQLSGGCVVRQTIMCTECASLKGMFSIRVSSIRSALLKEHICRAWGVQQGRDFSYQSVMTRPIQLMHRMIGAIAFVKVHKSRFYLPFRLFGANAALDPNVQLRFAYWQNLPSLCAYC
jgi:hypothetical protein